MKQLFYTGLLSMTILMANAGVLLETLSNKAEAIEEYKKLVLSEQEGGAEDCNSSPCTPCSPGACDGEM